jgi:hypothetical protein
VLAKEADWNSIRVECAVAESHESDEMEPKSPAVAAAEVMIDGQDDLQATGIGGVSPVWFM